ncbi:MAG: ATP synthase subunit I [Porticoccaceae bacterium]|nr:ATP synthase subunit I [Porticoccaceae bacterium]MDG1474086.1 ATP synthase subunit I [Porticoccaceae bacterium]
MKTIPQPAVFKASMTQLLALLLVGGLCFFYGSNQDFSGSIVLGGLIQLIPQLWFSREAFKYVGASQTQRIVNTMYRGEVGKVILTSSGFVTVFVLYDNVNIVALMAAFISMILVHLLLVARLVK